MMHREEVRNVGLCALTCGGTRSHKVQSSYPRRFCLSVCEVRVPGQEDVRSLFMRVLCVCEHIRNGKGSVGHFVYQSNGR